MNTDKGNLMNCDIDTGICEIVQTTSDQQLPAAKPVRLLYFTDPICSSCWGIEAQLRKLKQEYGSYFDIEYRMGGLLKSWDEYGGSDVNGPESVAQHWEEAGTRYEMPINGDVWKNDPLHSSYPPSIAFKAAQLQDNEKSALFLRRIKEMVFVDRLNITRMEHLVQAAADAGLDTDRFQTDYEGEGVDLFRQDLLLAREYGVRGFPTIYFIDEDDNRFKVYGSKPYETFEQALLKLAPDAVKDTSVPSGEAILDSYATITSKEFAVLSNQSSEQAELTLNSFEEQGKVQRVTAKTGILWRVIASS